MDEREEKKRVGGRQAGGGRKTERGERERGRKTGRKTERKGKREGEGGKEIGREGGARQRGIGRRIGRDKRTVRTKERLSRIKKDAVQ